VNPTYEEREKGDLDLVVAATKQAITMVECGAKELPEDAMLDALFAGEAACREIALAIEELVSRCNVHRQAFTPAAEDETIKGKVNGWIGRILEASFTPGKHARAQAIRALREQAITEITAG